MSGSRIRIDPLMKKPPAVAALFTPALLIGSLGASLVALPPAVHADMGRPPVHDIVAEDIDRQQSLSLGFVLSAITLSVGMVAFKLGKQRNR